MLEFIYINWISIIVPIIVFFSFFVVGFWIRKTFFSYLKRILISTKWKEGKLLLDTIHTPLFHWWLIFGFYVTLQFIPVSQEPKRLIGRILGSLFLLSLIWVIEKTIEKLIKFYLDFSKKYPLFSPQLIINLSRVIFSGLAILILLGFWGVPITPFILLITVGIVVLIIGARDEILNFVSGFELIRDKLIRSGDYIKLDSGEEGYVLDINWRNSQIKASDGSIIFIPNSKLIKTSFKVYRESLKKATQPFHFYTRLHLKELTGSKAKNLTELVELLREVPDNVIYYHTHRFIEEYQFLIPQPPNDFALWVDDALGNEILAERLASIDTFEFPTIGELRQRLIDVIKEELSERGRDRDSPEGREFYFIKSISVIMPTPYIAHDLREFLEALRQVSINSIYFHVFESRLRLHRGVNDFSIWLKDCLDEKELAEKISILDPYNYTMEGLRSVIIQFIEERIR